MTFIYIFIALALLGLISLLYESTPWAKKKLKKSADLKNKKNELEKLKEPFNQQVKNFENELEKLYETQYSVFYIGKGPNKICSICNDVFYAKESYYNYCDGCYAYPSHSNTYEVSNDVKELLQLRYKFSIQISEDERFFLRSLINPLSTEELINRSNPKMSKEEKLNLLELLELPSGKTLKDKLHLEHDFKFDNKTNIYNRLRTLTKADEEKIKLIRKRINNEFIKMSSDFTKNNETAKKELIKSFEIPLIKISEIDSLINNLESNEFSKSNTSLNSVESITKTIVNKIESKYLNRRI